MSEPNRQPTTDNRQQKILIFDLDGTIADTLKVVIQIYNEVVVPKLRCRPADFADREILQNQPVGKLFKAYGITWYKLPFVIYLVKKHLNRQIANILPFPSLTPILHQLKESYALGIVTSNSEKNAQQFLNQHQLTHLFDFVYTNNNIFGKHKTLERLIDKHQFQKKNILYIGDETRDIHAARRAGIGMLAVTWGYLGKELLENRKPDVLVEKVEDLVGGVEQYFTKVL